MGSGASKKIQVAEAPGSVKADACRDTAGTEPSASTADSRSSSAVEALKSRFASSSDVCCQTAAASIQTVEGARLARVNGLIRDEQESDVVVDNKPQQEEAPLFDLSETSELTATSTEELFASCRDGPTTRLLKAIKAAGQLNVVDGPDNDSVLHVAARAGQADNIQILLKSGRLSKDALNAPNSAGRSPLHIGCQNNQAAVAAVLLAAGADGSVQDTTGATPWLLAAAGRGGVHLFDQLLASLGASAMEAVDDKGVGAVHFASLRADSQLLSWLLAHGANVNLQTTKGITALMLTVCSRQWNNMSLLVDAKADLSLADSSGCTALAKALSSAALPAVERFLRVGASVDATDLAGRGVVFHAVLGGCAACLAAVILRGGRVNTMDEDGQTPLYQACLAGAEDIVRQLIAAGADPNLAGRGSRVRGPTLELDDEDATKLIYAEARTCIQVCAFLGHHEIMVQLLEARCEVDAAPGPLGWTALHICAVLGNAAGAALLLDHGAETAFEDAEGSTAEALAARVGESSSDVLTLIRAADAAAREQHVSAAAAATNVPDNVSAALDSKDDDGNVNGVSGNVELSEQAPSKTVSCSLGKLPPLRAAPLPPAFLPEAERQPLEGYHEVWEQRLPREGSLLDRVFGPMVHDALKSVDWRLRWEALTFVASSFQKAAGGSSEERISAVVMLLVGAALEKVPKVLLASIALFQELVSDTRLDEIDTTVCAASFRHGEVSAAEGLGSDAVSTLLSLSEAASKSSVQSAAVNALCTAIIHGRLSLDEVAHPLLVRVDKLLRESASGSSSSDGGRRLQAVQADIAKALAADFKILGQWMAAFGLQNKGIFRRSLLLPLILLGVVNNHAKVRACAGEVLARLVALSGNLEERIWALLPEKVCRVVQRLATGEEGAAPICAVPCDEDILPKTSLVNEDARAADFLSVSELTPETWAKCYQGPLQPHRLVPEVNSGDIDANKSSWKVRVEEVNRQIHELSEATGAATEIGGWVAGTGSILDRYAMCGRKLSHWASSLEELLNDPVAAVFQAAVELLLLVCSRAGAVELSEALVECALPVALARLADGSRRVRASALQVAMQLFSILRGSLGNAVVRSVVQEGRGFERCAAQRLQLLVRFVSERSASGADECCVFYTETWEALGACIVRTSEHRSAEVRKEASKLLLGMRGAGEPVAVRVANAAASQMQTMADQKACRRPGTGMRPKTGSGAPPSRCGTQLGQLGTVRCSNLDSSLRTSIGSRAPASRCGTSSRCGTASNLVGAMASYGRCRTGRQHRKMQAEYDAAEDSDNSLLDFDVGPEFAASGNCEESDAGIKFFDVTSPRFGWGADEAPDVDGSEALLKEMLQVAEPIEAEAVEFVAPLVKLFGENWTRCFYSRNWQCRVAALTHLAACVSGMAAKLPRNDGGAHGARLLDGTMRAIHEGMGDQNLRVYTEACVAVTACVPSLCGVVDGRLLVAHLAPLLRQFCARLGDSKEMVRSQTVTTLFGLLRSPAGEIVSPSAVATLVLTNIAPEGGSTQSKAASAVVGWLCRLSVLRDLVRYFHQRIAQDMLPGEWLRLSLGLKHADPTVRRESARLYALACKAHCQRFRDVDASLEDVEKRQTQMRESWVAALPEALPAKSLAQVRRLLKLPEGDGSLLEAGGTTMSSSALAATSKSQLGGLAMTWEPPASLAAWAGCDLRALGALCAPVRGDEDNVVEALNKLYAGLEQPGVVGAGGCKPDEAFGGICKALQQALGSEVGGNRAVLLKSVDICSLAVTTLATALSGLDLNIGLSKTLQVLLARISMSGALDVKASVASDKLVRQLAQHPKVGCEAASKMVVGAVARAERPARPLMLLGTLLGEYGIRLCAQRDFVSQLLVSVAAQLERIEVGHVDEKDVHSLQLQLVDVLGKCNQFSSETVRFCLNQTDLSARERLVKTLRQAPNPKLVALGAAAAELDALESGSVASGNAARALGRRRNALKATTSSVLSEGDVKSPIEKVLRTSQSTGALQTRPLQAQMSGAEVSQNQAFARNSISGTKSRDYNYGGYKLSCGGDDLASTACTSRASSRAAGSMGTANGDSPLFRQGCGDDLSRQPWKIAPAVPAGECSFVKRGLEGSWSVRADVADAPCMFDSPSDGRRRLQRIDSAPVLARLKTGERRASPLDVLKEIEASRRFPGRMS